MAVLRRLVQVTKVLMYRCPNSVMIGVGGHKPTRRWCNRWLFHDGSHRSDGWGWS